MIASTDYMKLYADQVRPFVPARYRVLGTDGFGRSDYRASCARSSRSTGTSSTIAALKALADENKIPSIKVAEAIKAYGIDPEKPNPART